MTASVSARLLRRGVSVSMAASVSARLLGRCVSVSTAASALASVTVRRAGACLHRDGLAFRSRALRILLAVYIQLVTVQIYAARAAGQAGDIAVTGQSPGGSVLDLHIDVARLAVTVDRAAEAAALLEVQIQRRDFVHDHIAVNGLLRRRHRHMAAVAAFTSPACRGCSEEYAFLIFVYNSRPCQIDGRRCIVDKKYIAVKVRQCPAVHGKRGKPLICVAGHGLIDHDRLVPVGFVTVLFHIAGCKGHIVECDGILAFYDYALRSRGLHLRVTDRDICRGVDDRRTGSFSCIASARHIHSTAASVGTNRRRAVAGSVNQEVGGIHRAAARRHQAAGAIAGGLDHRIGDIDCRPFPIAEHTVCMGAVGVNRDLAQRQRRSVCRKDRRVGPVEIRFVAGGLSCLDDGDVGVRSFFPVRRNRVLFVCAVLICIGYLDLLF